jgi:hypothetical protein
MKSPFSPNYSFVLFAFICIAAAALTLAPAATATADDAAANYPADFLAAAKAFANAPVTDRFAEAYALNKKLPKAQRMNAANRGGRRFRNRDRNAPAIVLSEGDLVRLLGTARYTNSTAYGYPATKDSCLWVFYYNGRVTDSTLSADKPPIFATNLLQTASGFRDAPATNRLNQARALHQTLPTAPVTSNSGVANSSDPGSRFVYKDADNPTFILREADIARLLGRPDYNDPECYAYALTKDEDKAPQLLLFFHDAFVVGSAIENAPNPTPTK